MYKKGVTTRANKNNRILVESNWIFSKERDLIKEELMLDPQTNGGLLIAVPESITQNVLDSLNDAGISSSVRIGHISNFTKSKIRFI